MCLAGVLQQQRTPDGPTTTAAPATITRTILEGLWSKTMQIETTLLPQKTAAATAATTAVGKAVAEARRPRVTHTNEPGRKQTTPLINEGHGRKHQGFSGGQGGSSTHDGYDRRIGGGQTNAGDVSRNGDPAAGKPNPAPEKARHLEL